MGGEGEGRGKNGIGENLLMLYTVAQLGHCVLSQNFDNSILKFPFSLGLFSFFS